MKWKDNLISMDENLAGTAFRHGVQAVAVSDIASQYYCELKVEHQHVQGEVPTEATEEGTAIHDDLLAMEKVSRSNLIERIETRRNYVAAFPIGARIGRILLRGLPDAVVFRKSRPLFVVELKTTMGDVSRLWPDQVVQAKTYALVLDSMGFDCSDLTPVITRIKRRANLSKMARRQFLESTVAALFNNEPEKLEAKYGGDLKVFLLKYERQDALKGVEWAQSYWLEEREAIPTTKPAKCKACTFRETCPSSLAN